MSITELDTTTEEAGARLPIRHRQAQIEEVRYPDRIIELIAVPYNKPALVPHKGRMVSESFLPGSFDGVERRAGRIKVNREHELTRPIGRAVALHPSRKVGLVAEIRIAQTVAGDEALALAEDGVLDASVGFAPFPNHEQWSNDRKSVQITKAFLHHIALTADPAYEDANVLAVRSSDIAAEEAAVRQRTPNLDQVRSWMLMEKLGVDSRLSTLTTEAQT